MNGLITACNSTGPSCVCVCLSGGEGGSSLAGMKVKLPSDLWENPKCFLLRNHSPCYTDAGRDGIGIETDLHRDVNTATAQCYSLFIPPGLRGHLAWRMYSSQSGTVAAS